MLSRLLNAQRKWRDRREAGRVRVVIGDSARVALERRGFIVIGTFVPAIGGTTSGVVGYRMVRRV
jgi:hypothetical protein